VFSLGCISVSNAFGQRFVKLSETTTSVKYALTNDSLSLLPSYNFNLPIDASITIEKVESVEKEISASLLKELKKYLVNADSSQINSIISYSSSIGTVRGKKIRNGYIHPTSFSDNNANSIRVVKNIVFNVPKFFDTNESTARKVSTTINSTIFSDNSPFSQGDWFKIPITKDGIYALNASYLSSLGIDISTISTSSISIWMGPSRMLPLRNADSRPQLIQIPILIENSSNNTFSNDTRVLFYGHSASGSMLNSIQQLEHQRHYFTDTSFVFLSFNAPNTSTRTIPTINLNGGTPVNTVEQIRWKEDELFKTEEDLKSGMNWLGQRFTNEGGLRSQTIFEEPIAALSNGTPLSIQIRSVVRSVQSSTMQFFQNATESIGQTSYSPISSYTAADGRSGTERVTFLNTTYSGNDNILRLSATADLRISSAQAWIDYVIIKYIAPLVADNDYLSFFAPVDQSGLLSYTLEGFSSSPYVFDVTNPQAPISVGSTRAGNSTTFSSNKIANQSFIAQSEPFTPESGQTLVNQNLRGITTLPDLLVVTNQRLLAEAQEYASYRRETDPNITSLVVDQRQIFNEYGNGGADVVAIRDFIRHLTAKAQRSNVEAVRYLLFFGDATYDYKGIVEESSLSTQVITFQTLESIDRISSYGTDDFFGLLDDNEGDMVNRNQRIDIGIGRLPVNSPSQARIILNKIRQYESQESLGSWRNTFTFVADDELNGSENDGDLHVLNADGTVIRMETEKNGVQFNKIYLPSYPVVVTAEGRRIPAAKSDLIRSINTGSLVVNYSGHGAEQLLSAERVFRSEDISSLTNSERPTIFVTATCSFGRYDDDLDQSGAEKLLLYPTGGAVASFTTTRVVYTSSGTNSANNFTLNIDLSKNMVTTDENGLPKRLGDIYLDTKATEFGAAENSRKFILLGDPLMRIGLGQQKAVVTEINGKPALNDTTFTIQGLATVQLKGMIQNAQNQLISNFNGEVEIEIFDAVRSVRMLERVESERPCNLDDCSYDIQNDLLFRGRASVTNGLFTASFIVPKDISNSVRNGRINLYAKSTNSIESAAGSTNQVFFNGINKEAATDTKGPEIEAWLNDPFFVDGSIVNNNPTLFLELEDPSGINTTGSGIGHELSASLDTDPPLNFDLNRFFTGDLDNFSKGQVNFPIEDLPNGTHTMKIRAWDVHNNLSETELRFEVLDESELVVRNLYNYPNPMSNFTRFVFEHNQTAKPLKVSIRIFTLSGKPVNKLVEELTPTGNFVTIEWNGRDIDGNAIANGTYLYHVIVQSESSSGQNSYEKIEKLVLIR
jgi:hypothetical protein